MGDIGNCFICGEKAQYAHFYDIAVGHFVKGSEPRLCASCNDKLHEMTDEQRKKLFEIFEVMDEPPEGNPFEMWQARSDEIKNRGRA